MFDTVVLAEMSDEALISALTAATRSEAMAAAERLALVAEVTARECEDEDDGSAHAVIDGWAFAKAQVSAACNLNPRAANTQMRIGVALRERLPRTAALLAAGTVSAKVIGEITWRTRLVTDEGALALIDAAIAGEAATFGALSDAALTRAVDFWVEKFDPIAVIQSNTAAKNIYVEFDDHEDPNGVSSFWGRLRATDKAALEQRLNDLAATVCANDPRPIRERRADAMGALGIVGPSLDRIACRCGDPDCEGSGKDPRSTAVTIYVLTDQIPGTGARPAGQPGPGPRSTPTQGPDGTGEPEPTPEATPEPEPDAPGAPDQPAATIAGAGTGVLLDGGIIPAAMLADLIATGATVRPLREVADLPTERQYRPSSALTAFVQMRSMTCSFPGCNRPAHRCDLDHLTPWPAGATHPGNLRPLCREHHMLKTFRTGPGGWSVTSRPDGRTEWDSPTGHTYVTSPGAAILFPHWNIHTEVPPPRPITLLHDEHRGTKMPTRGRTRAQDREYRINAERTRNALQLALAREANDRADKDKERVRKSIAEGTAATGDIFNGRFTNDSDPPPF